MNPQEVRFGVQVRVGEHHRIEARRRMVGRVVGRYGRDNYVAVDVCFVDVCFADGRCRLFWPADLEAISSPQPSW